MCLKLSDWMAFSPLKAIMMERKKLNYIIYDAAPTRRRYSFNFNVNCLLLVTFRPIFVYCQTPIAIYALPCTVQSERFDAMSHQSSRDVGTTWCHSDIYKLRAKDITSETCLCQFNLHDQRFFWCLNYIFFGVFDWSDRLQTLKILLCKLFHLTKRSLRTEFFAA